MSPQDRHRRLPDDADSLLRPSGPVHESIVGEPPYRWSAVLRFAGGSSNEPGSGTAFLVTPTVLMTAAHNLYEGATKRFRARIDISMPGLARRLDASNAVFLVPPAFVSNTVSSTVDYGFIVLAQPVEQTGVELKAYTDEQLRYGLVTPGRRAALVLRVVGHARDDRGATQLMDYKANVRRETLGQRDKAGYFLYDIKRSEGGMSGGPIGDMLRWEKERWTVVGVHQGKAHAEGGWGRATRITADVLAAFADAQKTRVGDKRSPNGLLVAERPGTGAQARAMSSGRRERAEDPPPVVDRLYIVDSPDAEVIHLLPDCPGFVSATHHKRERPFAQRSDLTEALIEEGRRPCESCSERVALTADEARRIEEGLAAPPSPPAARYAVEVEGVFGALRATADTIAVRGWNEKAFVEWPMAKLVISEHDGPPRITFRRGSWLFGERMTMMFDDTATRDATLQRLADLWSG